MGPILIKILTLFNRRIKFDEKPGVIVKSEKAFTIVNLSLALTSHLFTLCHIGMLVDKKKREKSFVPYTTW